MATKATGNLGQWRGMNSGIDPEFLPSNVCFQTMNTVSRGGVVRTRPGFRSLWNAPNGWPQGCTFFTTNDDVTYFVFAVNGYVYYSQYPFTEYNVLPNIRFSDVSMRVNFQITQQTTSYTDDGIFVQLARPINTLMMQDGRSRAAYWNGTDHGHLSPERSTGELTEPGKDGTPIGQTMAWVADRLWVFRDNLGFASDIGNPLKFTETQYLSEARAFLFPGKVTGAVQPYVESPLIVFTKDTLTQIQAQIRDRSKWITIDNFQQTEYTIGCVAPKSIVKSFGETWWFSQYGMINLDFAMRTQQTSKFQYVDNQMAVSKAWLSPTLDRICGAAFENYVLMSVPSGHIYNEHTWVLDQMNTPGGEAAWDGYWTGIRPVEWATEEVAGDKRIFCLSYDSDGVSRVWEAFDPTRTDNGCPITCMMETKIFNDDSKEDKQYKNARVFLNGIEGDVDLSVSVAATHGPYYEVMQNRFIASQGSVKDGYLDDGLIDFLPQNRVVNTQHAILSQENCEGCGIESKRPHNIDYGFSHLFLWSGNMGVSGVQMIYEEQTTNYEPDCFDDESGDKIVAASGCESDDRDSIPDGETVYTSTQEVTATCLKDPNITATVSATRTSRISQEDADDRALCAASAEAEAELWECSLL